MLRDPAHSMRRKSFAAEAAPTGVAVFSQGRLLQGNALSAALSRRVRPVFDAALSRSTSACAAAPAGNGQPSIW